MKCWVGNFNTCNQTTIKYLWNAKSYWPVTPSNFSTCNHTYMKCWTTVTNHYWLHEMLNYSDQSLLATWNVELRWPIITGYMKCWTTVTNHYWLHEMLKYSDQSLLAASAPVTIPTWNVEVQWPITTSNFSTCNHTYMKCWSTVTNHY